MVAFPPRLQNAKRTRERCKAVAQARRQRLVSRAGATAIALALAIGLLPGHQTDALTLTLYDPVVTFTCDDPDLFPSVQAAENPVRIRALILPKEAGACTLTVLAAGDLSGGSGAVPIESVWWTASGAGYLDGRMSKSAPVLVGAWSGSGAQQGLLTFRMDNSWNYPSGYFTQVALFTLSSP